MLSVVIRMVVPMRREFGRSLDVQQFMRDQAYARTVLDEALGSRDQRLRDYAEYVHKQLAGPRVGTGLPATPAVPAPVATAPTAAAAPDATEAELRARMLKRYTGGLR